MLRSLIQIKYNCDSCHKEQKEYETIEQDIAALEEKIRQTQETVLACATDFVKLNELTKEKQILEDKLESLMDRYVYLEELAEQIQAQTK